MTRKLSSNFLIGVIFGLLACVLLWYWQKSTQAEDGALALLDRLKAAESKMRQLQAELARHAQTAVEQSPAAPAFEPDDLEQVKGIGPVFAARLQEAGINTFQKLANMSAADLANVLQISEGRAGQILAEARNE